MAGGETLLEGRGLRKRFGDIIAVDGISVALESARILAVLGPNGAGKTTTVAMLAGLTTPDAGDVLIGGRPLAGDTDPAKRRMGLVPQDLALYEELSARDNLRFFGALYGLAGGALERPMTSPPQLGRLPQRARHRLAKDSGRGEGPPN